VPPAFDGPPPLIYSPRSLAEALALFVPNPHAKLFAGGTSWPDSQSGTVPLPAVTISLHWTEDLKKVTYGERFLDLGGGLTLNQLLSVRGPWVPAILKHAASVIGTSALRNLATVAGNLCRKDVLGDLFPCLYLLGAQFEARNLRGSRWISAQDVADQGRLTLLAGEILTRVRIPQGEWPLSFYQKIGTIRTPRDERISLAAIARTKTGQLETLRFAFHLPHVGLLRVRDLEAELQGQRLPLPHRVRQVALDAVAEGLERLPESPSMFQRDRVQHMTRWILTRLEEE